MSRGSLDGVSAFLKVAERQNFRAAARDLGVSPSALSQTIRALEARIGIALLARTTRSVALTEAGRLLRDAAAPALAELDKAFEAVHAYGGEPSGTLRINGPRGVMPFLLDPIVGGYQRLYPNVEVELFAEDGLADIVRGGFDAGIRFGELLQPDMVALRLSPPFRFVVTARRDYLEANGTPRLPEDLAHHRCIRARHPSGGVYRWEFRRNDSKLAIAVAGPLILNDVNTIIAAGLQGAGLIYTAEPMVAPHIARGALVEVLADFSVSTPGMYLYYPSRAQMMPKLRAFVDFMRSPDARRHLAIAPATAGAPDSGQSRT